MSKNALVFLNLQVTGDGINPLNIVPNFVSNTNSPAVHQLVALTTNTNIITPPLTAQYALIVPISLAVVTKTFKGSTADNGYPISITQPTLISLAANPGTFVIYAGGAENLDFWFI